MTPARRAQLDDQGFVLLERFTPDNGATRLVPGSHRWGRRPQDVLADPMAPHPQEVLLLGRAGSVAVMNSHRARALPISCRSAGLQPCLHAVAQGFSPAHLLHGIAQARALPHFRGCVGQERVPAS
jgi:hypothetical protein